MQTHPTEHNTLIHSPEQFVVQIIEESLEALTAEGLMREQKQLIEYQRQLLEYRCQIEQSLTSCQQVSPSPTEVNHETHDTTALLEPDEIVRSFLLEDRSPYLSQTWNTFFDNVPELPASTVSIQSENNEYPITEMDFMFGSPMTQEEVDPCLMNANTELNGKRKRTPKSRKSKNGEDRELVCSGNIKRRKTIRPKPGDDMQFKFTLK